MYLPADKEVVYHTMDHVLKEITIELPEPPDYRVIDGYGLHPDDQKFVHPQMPQKLVKLQEREVQVNGGKTRTITIDEVNKELQDNQARYRKEIRWIKRQWRRRVHGYWFFNHGKPTFMTGWNYFYTGFWNVGNGNRKDGMPDYRDRDRRFFLFADMCYNDPKSYGFTYPKHRREGATFKSEAINYIICTSGYKRFGGIQSMTEEHAKKAFREKLIEPWKTLPWFWRAVHNQTDDPKSIMEMKPPAKRSKGGVSASTGTALQGAINYENSSEGAYDGDKLYFLHHDEVGKKSAKAPVRVDKRWDISKRCLAQGPDIHGMSILTSTVGKMEGGGGKEFYSICKDSMYHERNANGQTKSGLYNLFIPACDGLDGFVDEYGMSIVDDPEKPVRNSNGDMVSIGALTYLKNEREALLQSGDLDKLDELTRLFPLQFRECFRPPQKNSGWNVLKLHSRIEELEDRGTVTQRGNFEWKNDLPYSQVEFRPTENGRFLVSYFMPQGEDSLKFQNPDDGMWYPSPGTNMVAGSDPFKYEKKSAGGSKSKGGGAVFWMRDMVKDPDGKHLKDWQSHRFVCTYLSDISVKELYMHDMLKMCIYYRAKMNAEQNVNWVNEGFEDLGYGGYLIYGLDNRGDISVKPGVYVSDPVKQDIYSMYMDYIEYHAFRENHLDLLHQLSDVSSIDDMTRLDLFAAGGYALLGTKLVNKVASATDDGDVIDIGTHWGY